MQHKEYYTYSSMCHIKLVLFDYTWNSLLEDVFRFFFSFSFLFTVLMVACPKPQKSRRNFVLKCFLSLSLKRVLGKMLAQHEVHLSCSLGL